MWLLSLPNASVHHKDYSRSIQTNEALLCQLQSEAASDLLQLIDGVVAGVNLEAGLSSSKGYIHTRTLVGHEGRQSLHFISAHIHGIADACVGDRERVMGDIETNEIQSPLLQYGYMEHGFMYLGFVFCGTYSPSTG